MGVICDAPPVELRLVGGAPGVSGRLEIRADGKLWGTVSRSGGVHDGRHTWGKDAWGASAASRRCCLRHDRPASHPPCLTQICGDKFGDEDATVACRQLGLATPGRTLGAFYGAGTGPTWLESVSCIGSEGRLQDCPKSEGRGRAGRACCVHAAGGRKQGAPATRPDCPRPCSDLDVESLQVPSRAGRVHHLRPQFGPGLVRRCPDRQAGLPRGADHR